MNRRRLLQLLAGGLTLDPERALWTPGAKLISIPAPRVEVITRRWPASIDFAAGEKYTITELYRRDSAGGYTLVAIIDPDGTRWPMSSARDRYRTLADIVGRERARINGRAGLL